MISMLSLEKPSLNELSHFGILGMKWGKHKAESASVTKARKDLEKQKTNVEKTVQQMNKETAYGMLATSNKTLKKVNTSQLDLKYSRDDLSTAKILDKLKGTKKSSLQITKEAEYKKKGVSNDEAAVAAYQNIKTRKILLGLGAVALGVAAYKTHNYRADKIFKSGSLIQHMTADSTKGVNDAFYAAGNKLDKIKYQGLFAGHLKRNMGGDAFKKDIKLLADIKQASHKNAKATLGEMVRNDPVFAAGLKAQMTPRNIKVWGGVYGPKTVKAEAALRNGKVDKNVYEVFNASLVDHSPEMQKLTDAYYKALSKKGYNAIKDINDSKYSGYKAINPIIAFNTAGKIEVVSVRKLAEAEVAKANKIGQADIITKDLAKIGAQWTAGILGAGAASKAINTKTDIQKAAAYRKKNPGSKMTNTQIVRMLERKNA
jgi:hypothetical protein